MSERFQFGDLFRDGADCGREPELLQYFEGRLSGAERDAFESHLAGCNACMRKLAALQKEERAVNEVRLDPEISRGILARSHDNLRASLDAKYPAGFRAGLFGSFKMPSYAT